MPVKNLLFLVVLTTILSSAKISFFSSKKKLYQEYITTDSQMLVPSGNFSMANASLIFLQESNIPINCLVYSLTSGNLSVDPWDYNGTLDLPQDFLPAYYITNCLIPLLVDLVMQLDKQEVHALDAPYHSPYNDRDNGDTFVALLFTISGSCVSCWMLLVLLYLSPKHKRKPLTTHAATIFYAVVTTILFTQITNGSKTEYSNDTLDIIKLRQSLYINNSYRVTNIFSQTFNHLAFMQIVLAISKNGWRWVHWILGLVLIIAYTVLVVYYEIKYNDMTSIFNSEMDLTGEDWRIGRIVIKLLILTWLGILLIIFTTKIKNPSLCYSKKLFPLAFFNGLVIVLAIVLNILSASLFRNQWLVKTWLELLPYMLEVVLATTVWEWIKNILFLEKRKELLGILGRRISIDDVLGVELHFDPKDTKRNKFLRALRRRSEVVSLDGKELSSTSTGYENTTFMPSNDSVQENIPDRDEEVLNFDPGQGFAQTDTSNQPNTNEPNTDHENTHSYPSEQPENGLSAQAFHNGSTSEHPTSTIYTGPLHQDTDETPNPQGINPRGYQSQQDHQSTHGYQSQQDHQSTHGYQSPQDQSPQGVHHNSNMHHAPGILTGDDIYQLQYNEYLNPVQRFQLIDITDEYLDNYEVWNDDDDDDFDLTEHLQNQQAMGLTQAPPPPFQPHPGFSMDDYWPEDKRTG